jgi:tripartite-type tricarboxylate transporter receptor subunit TctC
MSSCLKKVCAVLGSLGFALAPQLTHAQAQFPTKPVRLVVTFSPGGAADQTARIVAERLSERWKPYSVVVENILGAGGNVGADVVNRAAPDGYTLLLVSNTHAINRVIFPKTPFDITKDFEPIGMMSSSPIVIASHPKAKLTNLKGLVDQMEQQKGQMNYLTCGVATAHHFAMELIKDATKQAAVHIPHKGCGPAVFDAVAGQVDTVIATMPAVLPFIKQGKLIPLAVTSSARSESARDIPTVAESGIASLKDYAVENYYGLAAPGGTPKEIVAKIQADLLAVLNAPETKTKFANAGLDLFVLGARPMGDLLKADVVRYRKAVQTAGIKPE